MTTPSLRLLEVTRRGRKTQVHMDSHGYNVGLPNHWPKKAGDTQGMAGFTASSINLRQKPGGLLLNGLMAKICLRMMRYAHVSLRTRQTSLYEFLVVVILIVRR
jgi:hypothetical protein